MKISILCKLGNVTAYDFFRPLIDTDEIKQISVFRDFPCNKNSKLKYFIPRTLFKNRILKKRNFKHKMGRCRMYGF